VFFKCEGLLLWQRDSSLPQFSQRKTAPSSEGAKRRKAFQAFYTRKAFANLLTFFLMQKVQFLLFEMLTFCEFLEKVEGFLKKNCFLIIERQRRYGPMAYFLKLSAEINEKR